MKKSLCFIAYSEGVCRSIRERLEETLGDFLHIATWCLETSPDSPPNGHDLYVASHHSTFSHVRKHLSARQTLIVANRFLNPVNFEKLLLLKPGAGVLLCARSRDRAELLHNTIHSYGIKHLELFYNYNNIETPPPQDVEIAVVAGMNSHIPPWITKVIDLGAKEITLDTYTRIFSELSIKESLLNDIADKYMRAIFTMTRKYYEMKKKAEAVLQSVDSAVLSIDANGMIDDANDAAVHFFGLDREAKSIHISGLFPEYARLAEAQNGAEGFGSDILESGGQQYALAVRSVLDDSGAALGSVITANPVRKVQALEQEVRRKLKNKGHVAKHTFGQIIGSSPEIQKAVTLARRFARTDLAILLEGESGSGKELFAQSIHTESDRRDAPFVALNFAALPESLAESELFGYEEGAFTGALRGGRAGLFEEAHNGTLFLDEVGDASLELQTKLLRVLEEKEVRPVGGRVVIPVNVRIVAATNKNLAQMMRQGLFRSDLFYRLCACPLRIPPLRQRHGDLLALLQEFAFRQSRRRLVLNSEVRNFLLAYPWPGNVRELQNVVNYLCNIAPGREAVTLEHLPEYLFSHAARPAESPAEAPGPDDLEWRLSLLRRKGMLETCRAVLTELAFMTARQKTIGRYAMRERLRQRGVDIPPHRLRACLTFLKEGDFVRCGVTKQGTRLTGKGEALLEKMETA